MAGGQMFMVGSRYGFSASVYTVDSAVSFHSLLRNCTNTKSFRRSYKNALLDQQFAGNHTMRVLCGGLPGLVLPTFYTYTSLNHYYLYLISAC